MGVYSSTAANAYADKVKAVYEHLDQIKKVADRLTPVEDLTVFQNQIEALYSRLDLLVEASNLIVTATEIGELILTGSRSSIRTLLGIGEFPDDYLTQADLDAALANLPEVDLTALQNTVQQIDLVVTELDQYRLIQQSLLSGLETNYQNIAGELETHQSNTELILQRLTVREQYATLIDQRLDAISQSLDSTILGVQANNDILAGHTASIETHNNYIALHTASIDQLSSNLVLLDQGVTANASALSLMETNITGIGNDLTVQAQQTTALKSVIGGSGNLLPNADFNAGANGWRIVVAEEDWATTVLTTNTFTSMPEEVNCLEVLGEPSPLGQIVVESPTVLVEGNEYYLLSGYPCVDNGTAVLSYKTFDLNGDVVDQGECPVTFNATTNPNISAYSRTWVKFQASATAVKMRAYLTVTGDGDWITQGALFRPMIEQGWSGQEGPSAWTPNIGDVPKALAEAIQTLSTEVSLIDGKYTAIAEAQLDLLARVGTTESALSSTMIVRSMQDSALASMINLLTAEVQDLETGAIGFSSALADLTARTTINEGKIDSQASSLTSLQSAIESEQVLRANAINELSTRVTAAENNYTSQSSLITSLQTSMDGKADSSAVSTLVSMVEDLEDHVTAQASYATNLETSLTADIAATVAANESLSVRIDEQDGKISLLNATYTVNLNVNGYASGFSSVNDGDTATFNILADKLNIAAPGVSGPSLTWTNGTFWNKGVTKSLLIGQGMGVDQDLLLWVGPNPVDAASLLKDDAVFYVDEAGNAVFTGIVKGSILSGSALELGSTRIHTGGGRLAPFAVKASAYRAQHADFAGSVTLSNIVSPDSGTGYHYRRCSRSRMDVRLDCFFQGDGNSGDKENLYLEVQYDGGAWQTITSMTSIDTDNHGSWVFLIRYTTKDVWNTCAFRARTSLGHTAVLSLSLEIDNTYETTNAPHSWSGTDASSGI